MPEDAAAVVSPVRVRYAETDQMGVVYHANYLVWMEIGRTDYCRACGAAYRELEAAGLRLVVAAAQVRYHAPARYDDDLCVVTRLVALRSRQVTFAYEIWRTADGTRLVTGETTHLPTDPHGRIIRLPPSVQAALASKLAPGHGGD
ncbi:acyl-CoA thioesterase [Chloracidobacterium validum]|uniref:Acyl-CoA thioesterase n=2 Tax=Chloracidobacterium validum TaxID=2821543 RepID=A0ABX8BE26_9BACT|nr:acyl-CoA thioesterase [Chloracidobacterium validum]